uniref:Uncharacterized protein n=2 Tax=Corethron hystrix TaxID=216773 RepID=A0A6U5DYA2_9STRA|mmetsp:Transcript_14874/g.33001  ORF Transcript_14874/g.33001 Transcript_14874/m.33001 type:complete len:413 (+) Transcript_14874:348-1586(+)
MVSSMVVFAWAGLVIFNIFLIGIIFWASASSWIFGLILNVVYMACLLCLALYVENSLLADEKDRDEENLDDPANSWGGDKEEIKKLIKQINEVIYMLFVLSLGTVGITLSINLGCNFDGLGDLFNGDDLPVKCIQQMARKISVGILFVSCAPVLVASFMIYTFKFSVPSMFLTFYLGLCMLVTSLFIAVETDVAEIDASINVFLKWWLMVTGALMVAIQSYLSLSRRLFLNVRGWTAFTAGLPYFVGACWVLGIFTDWWGWLPWIVLNCICIVPLLFLGFALGEVVYSSLGAIGLVLDAINAAWRFGNYISDTNFFFPFYISYRVFMSPVHRGGGCEQEGRPSFFLDSHRAGVFVGRLLVAGGDRVGARCHQRRLAFRQLHFGHEFFFPFYISYRVFMSPVHRGGGCEQEGR